MEQPASPKPLPKASPDLVKKASSCASVAGAYPPRCRRPGAIAARSRNREVWGGQVCQICGDGVGTVGDGKLFTACYVCRFPMCRPCYEYEHKDSIQACLQCKTKYKRHKGSPPVRGE
uniref:Cesa5 n=1 Tax=Arundo donax TaxID=35708 RepID=A0A0A9GH03_ARUDO